MGNLIHETVPVLVWADVDIGIANAVRRLNEIPGVRTHASCQGTLGEGGAEPYRAHVAVSWNAPEAFERIRAEFDISDVHEAHCFAHPRATGRKQERAPMLGDETAAEWRVIEAAKAIVEAARVDLSVDGQSSVARVPAALTAKLAEALNLLSRAQKGRNT
jgi:hypothetical protein